MNSGIAALLGLGLERADWNIGVEEERGAARGERERARERARAARSVWRAVKFHGLY